MSNDQLCQNEAAVWIARWLCKKGLPWCGHWCRGSNCPWLDGMWRQQDSPVFFEHEFKITITVVIILVVWGRFLPVIIIAGCYRLAELSMPLHDIYAHCEIVEAVGTNEPQVVVCGPQVIYHCSFILVFFPATQAGQVTLPLQSLVWVDAL